MSKEKNLESQWDEPTYVSLLLKDMADLEPDVGVGKRVRRITQDTVEAVQTLSILALLLVNDTETEENLVGLVKVWNGRSASGREAPRVQSHLCPF